MTANDHPTPDSAAPATEAAPIGAPAPEPTTGAPTVEPTTAASAEPTPELAAAPDVTAPAGQPAAAEAAAPMSPAACAERLKALFPALFTGQAKPIKLRIQADIQARAPGVFSKASLSGFLRRYTCGTG